MSRLASVLAALVLAAAPANSPAAETYQLDPAHTFVSFSVAHLGLSRARGSFRDVAGTIQYDSADVTKSSVEVRIKTASVDTDNEGRDQHLRSPDFFDAEKFPEMTFKSRRVERRGQTYVARGELTIKGVAKEVELPFTLSGPIKDPFGGPSRLGVNGSLTIDRRDYGITWSRVMDGGGLFVGNDVTIDISLEASIPKPKPAQ